MVIEKEEIAIRLATLGYNATTLDDGLIDYLIQSVYQSILNECNVEEVPEGLKFVAIDMICGHILVNKLANGAIDIEKAVQSISEGDTSVTYASGLDPKQFLLDYYNGLIHNKELVKYRRLVW